MSSISGRTAGRRGPCARGWLTLAASLKLLREDFAMLAPFQRGGQAAHRQEISFHEEERALAHFHRVVDGYLAGTES